MPRRIIVIPRNAVVLNREQNRTRYVMDPRSGLMEGRSNVSSKQSDHTNVLRMSRDLDVNHDNRIDDRDLRKGQIVGRTSSSTKPSRVVVSRHWRKGGAEVREHVRTN